MLHVPSNSWTPLASITASIWPASINSSAYDLPVLTSDIPANRELASVADTFSVGDVNILACRLKEFLERCIAATSSRERIRYEFNWDQVAHQTDNIY